MNGAFRQSMSWLHTWAGLILGSLLYFMFVTGTAGYFDTEIDRWMQPEIVRPEGAKTLNMALLAEQYITQQVPDVESWRVSLPVGREPLLKVSWQGAQKIGGQQILNPHTGLPVTVRKTGGGQLLYMMHWQLHYLPNQLARWLTSIAAMFMLVALITGVVVHKKIFKDFFTFRPNKKQRSWLDMHNILSVLPLPFYFMITYSGLLYLAGSTMMPAIITGSYGSDWQSYFDDRNNRTAIVSPVGKPATQIPLITLMSDAEKIWGTGEMGLVSVTGAGDMNARVSISRSLSEGLGRGDTFIYDGVGGELLHETSAVIPSVPRKINSVLLSLHEGLFSRWPLRWLFFLSGIMGAGMIATGMILWAAKRRTKAEKSGKPHQGLAFVERMNVGTIIGLPIGIAVYFWANRLLAVNITDRAEKEVAALFVAWGITLIYPAFRSVRKAWVELLWVAAALYSLLPILNALTTEYNLVNTVSQDDWVMAGFDLTALVFGFLFFMAAYTMRGKNRHWLVKPTKKNTQKYCLPPQ